MATRPIDVPTSGPPTPVDSGKPESTCQRGGWHHPCRTFRQWRKRRDINAGPLEQLEWDSQHAAQSLGKMYDFAEGQARSAVDWYFGPRKRSKQRCGFLLRASAIVLTTIGGIIPMLVNARVLPSGGAIGGGTLVGGGGMGTIDWSQLGYVALALAGACIALDRFGGMTSGWIRYVVTGTRLRGIWERFLCEWNQELARKKGTPNTAEGCRDLLKLLCGLSTAVQTEVEKETEEWATEFRRNLAELEKSAREQLDAWKPGAIDLTIDNVEDAPAGVRVVVDGATRTQTSHRQELLRPIFPGPHFVDVQGLSAAGKALSAAQNVEVRAGETVKATLHLK